MIRMVCHQLVSHETVAVIKHFTRWLGRNYDIRHNIRIDVFYEKKIIIDENWTRKACYGFFEFFGTRSRRLPHIGLASIQTRRNLLNTIAHEFVHYEQWRDQRVLNERGVDQRACAIVQKYRLATS